MTVDRHRIRVKRFCLICGADYTYRNNRGWDYWFRFNDGWKCSKCYQRLNHRTRNPEVVKRFNAKNNPRVLTFKSRRILVQKPPRKGICQWCGARRGIECRVTNLHHIEYHDEDPLRDTIELCAKCHAKESWRLKRL
jgi:hypothetical protein